MPASDFLQADEVVPAPLGAFPVKLVKLVEKWAERLNPFRLDRKTIGGGQLIDHLDEHRRQGTKSDVPCLERKRREIIGVRYHLESQLPGVGHQLVIRDGPMARLAPSSV